MKLKDTFMSSPICVKILKYQCIPKNFLLLCRQFFSIHNLEADNFFQPTTACEQFFYEKSNPPDKQIMVRPLDDTIHMNRHHDRDQMLKFVIFRFRTRFVG